MLPKRVLIFSLTYAPYIGGAEIAIDEITRRISPNDIHFDLITLRADSNLPTIETRNNVTIHRIGPTKQGMTFENLASFPWYLIKVLYVPLAVLKARALAKGRPYDAYWCMMTNMVFPVSILRTFFGDTTPYLITLQDGDTIEHILGRGRIRPFAFLLRKAFAEASAVQTISRFLADLAKRIGYGGEPFVIPNGVSYEHFSDKKWKQDPERLVYRFDKKPNDVFLITTSRLVEKNAVDDIMRALPSLSARINLLIVGTGPQRDFLERLAAELGVEKRVRFVGHVPYEQIPAYLATSDIFIRPSLSEGMGNSFIEAMAAGLPVIATPVGGIVDFLFDPDTDAGEKLPTGLFCRVRDPKSIADSVTKFIENPALVHKLVQNAGALVRDVYEWDAIAERMRLEAFAKVFEE
ncbi:MAG: hypothetical protein RLY47_425 [Candidatus Parcubacteria bacterium]|jgi:glycosyltransferase involved in cell wall biosynthesis